MNTPRFQHKPRNYLHFDAPVSQELALRLATDPKRVARHSFYPFLGFTLKTLRIRREDGVIQPRSKEREIRIAAHRDASIYSWYSKLLETRYEAMVQKRRLGEVVKAFRSLPGGGSNIQFAAEVFDYIDQHRPCVALAFDIEKFFDTLDHDQLKQVWARALEVSRLPDDHFAVYQSLTRFSWVARDAAFKTFGISLHNPRPKGLSRQRICSAAEFRKQVRGTGLLNANPHRGKGIPQGSPMSAVLSNLYMIEFDSAIEGWVSAVGGLYRRYCDDIMLVIPPERANAAGALVREQIGAVKLTLNEGKTDRVTFPCGVAVPAASSIQYLGFTFDGARRLLRPASLTRYYGKMRRGVALAKQTQRKHNRQEKQRGTPLSALRKRKLYLQYSYIINRRRRLKNGNSNAHGNFLTYAYRAAEILSSPHIRQQVRGHWMKLQKEIVKPIKGQLRIS